MAQETPSLLSRLFGRRTGTADSANEPAKTASRGVAAAEPERVAGPESNPHTAERSNYVAAPSIDSIIRIEEVLDAEFFVGDLFRRRFHGDPPNYPRSFVAFYQPVRSRLEAVGFVHYLAFEDSYLCGGLVIDERRYRQMPAEHRKAIKAAGGIAEKMLRVTFARLADAPAIWGYVGDALAEKVDLRAGFRHTTHQHVMVFWNKDLSAEEKEQRLARVVALGPF
jgi:hypothetical protein